MTSKPGQELCRSLPDHAARPGTPPSLEPRNRAVYSRTGTVTDLYLNTDNSFWRGSCHYPGLYSSPLTYQLCLSFPTCKMERIKVILKVVKAEIVHVKCSASGQTQDSCFIINSYCYCCYSRGPHQNLRNYKIRKKAAMNLRLVNKCHFLPLINQDLKHMKIY